MFTRFSDLLKVAAVAVAAVSLSGTTALAQNVGDVGQDAAGNIYTFTINEKGERAWIPGRLDGTGVAGPTRTVTAERYTPTIWTDPDGCEHWIMDDGYEGFMTPHVRRDGTPVCHAPQQKACAVFQAGHLFSGHSHHLTHAGKKRLKEFFEANTSYAYAIHGHADLRMKEKTSVMLSKNRANVVGHYAHGLGQRLIRVDGHGGKKPIMHGKHKAPARENHRIEIYCIAQGVPQS